MRVNVLNLLATEPPVQGVSAPDGVTRNRLDIDRIHADGLRGIFTFEHAD